MGSSWACTGLQTPKHRRIPIRQVFVKEAGLRLGRYEREIMNEYL
jgi:hypothetical protein